MDLKSKFKIMHSAYQAEPYLAIKERKRILRQIKSALQNDAAGLVRSVNSDFKHRAEQETLFLELFPTIKAIDFCLKKMTSWAKKRPRNISWMFMPSRAYLMPQPLGVVGIMVPWNYPVYLALVPAAYAIAAGNRVMIKMSELSTHLGKELDSLIKSLKLEEYIQVINGDVEVAKEFAALPFGHLLFTGSTTVGAAVMKTASKNLTPLTLELGGKSPAVLSSSMKPKYFKRLFMGKLFNAGQTCIAPDYLLIPESWRERVKNEFADFINARYPDLVNNEQYTSIISSDHFQRLLDLVTDAKEKGAEVIEHGSVAKTNNKLPFFLIFNVTAEMNIMKEEIFGPILPVLCYKSFDQAVNFINARPNPLALYYFGEDKAEKDVLLTQTLSGALTINDTIMHIAIDDLPFGGVGASGMGQYHGQEGFDGFSKLKPVFTQSRFSAISWLYPPYGRLLNLFVAKLGGIKLGK